MKKSNLHWLLAATLAGTTGAAAPALAAKKLSAKDAQILSLEKRLEMLEKRLTAYESQGAAPATAATQQAAHPAPISSGNKVADAETVKQIDQKVKILERKMEVEKENTQSKWATFPKTVELGAQGLKVVSSDENFIMYLRALIQADSKFFMDDSGNQNTPFTNGDNLADQFTLRRVRPILEGTVWKWFDYRIMPDFGSGATRLFDAYVDIRYFREASLTAGKFKGPVSLERLQSASNLAFVERAYPSQLAPNRDVGFMLHGEFDKPGYPTNFSKLERNQTKAGSFPLYMYPEFFSYQLAVVDGSRNNGNIDSDQNDSKEFQGRIFAHPFLHTGWEALEGLGVGFAGTYGNPNDDLLSNYQSPGLATIFTYNSLARADGTQFRLYPQGYWIWGPFQLVGEYAYSSQQLANQVLVNNRTFNKNTTEANDQAWNVTASYVLTGEDNVFLRQGIKPRHEFDPLYGISPDKPFNPAEGHWGAFQVAARWTLLDFDQANFQNVGTAKVPIYPFADPRVSVKQANTWGLGLNWWLNSNVKLMLDYSQTSFTGGAGLFNTRNVLQTNITSREMEKVWQTRVQLAF